MKKLCFVLAFAMLLGLMIPSAFAADAYADAADGDLLYTADFNGTTGVWEPHAILSGSESTDVGWNWLTNELVVTPDLDDSTKALVEFNPEKKVNSAWGADFQNLLFGPGYSYTFKFTLTRDVADAPFGLYIDGHRGVYVYTYKGALRNNGSNMSGHTYCDYPDADSLTPIPGLEPNADELSVQEYAVALDGVEAEAGKPTITLYVKDANENWIELDSGEFDYETEGEEGEETIKVRPLTMYLYAYYNTNVAVTDLEVYKGVSVVTPYVPEIPDDDENEDEKTTNPPPVLVDDGEKKTEAPEPEDKGGCKSSIGLNVALIMIVSAAGVSGLTVRRKKHD